MSLSETLNCIYFSSEEENAMSIEENKDLPKSAKKKKLMDSRKKTDERKKQLLKVLLLTNPCIKESRKILIQLQKLMALSMLFTVFHVKETLHAIIWVLEMQHNTAELHITKLWKNQSKTLAK